MNGILTTDEIFAGKGRFHPAATQAARCLAQKSECCRNMSVEIPSHEGLEVVNGSGEGGYHSPPFMNDH